LVLKIEIQAYDCRKRKPKDRQRVMAVHPFGVSEAIYHEKGDEFVLATMDTWVVIPEVTYWAPWPEKGLFAEGFHVSK
jgi:hypothetical protein